MVSDALFCGKGNGWLFTWECEDYLGAGSIGGVDFYRTADCFGYGSAKRETYAGALLEFVDFSEALKYPFLLVAGNAGTGVGHGDDSFPGVVTYLAFH